MFRVPSPAPSVRPTSSASTVSSTRIAGRWVALLTTLLLGLFLGVLGATPAAAHDTLEGSDPADGATVATVPASVSLTFNEEVQNFSPVIQVAGPDGADWADGDPTVSGVDVSVPVKAGAPAGAYTVAYRIVSSDGHPVTGELTFTAEAPAVPSASSAPSSSAASTTPASSSATSSSAGAGTSSSAGSAAASSAPSSAAPSSALVSPAANTTDSGSGISGWLMAIIVLVVAAGGAVVAVLVRRARGGSPAA